MAAVRKRNSVDAGDEASDDVSIGAYFEGRRFESHAKAFADGEFEAWYSGLDIDLREATLDPAGAMVIARGLFSGIRIIVPETWNVDLHARSFAGGISNETQGPADGPLLTIEATAIFGGIQITTSAIPAWVPAGVAAAARRSEGHEGNGHAGNGHAVLAGVGGPAEVAADESSKPAKASAASDSQASEADDVLPVETDAPADQAGGATDPA